MLPPIFIPTRARAHVRGGTWRAMPKAMQDATELVVRADEADAYRMHYPTAQLLILPPRIEGISATRQHILEVATKRRYKRIVVCDDDITSLSVKRTATKYGTLSLATPRQWIAAFEWLDAQLREPTCGHAALSGRMQSAFPTRKFYYLNTRLAWKVLGVNMAAVAQTDARYDRTMFFQDLDMQLQLIKAGFNSIISTRYSYSARPERVAGGCETYRTDARMLAAARTFKRLHGDDVVIRTVSTPKTQQVRIKVRWARVRQYHNLQGE